MSSRPPLLTPGIVLAGTFPWANSAFEQLAPRPLVPVAHRPLIGFALSWLENAGVRRVVVCGNRSSRAIEAQIARGPAVDLDLSYLEDSISRGAAGCVHDAAMSCDGDAFIVTDAVGYPRCRPPRPRRSYHRRSSGAAVTAVCREARGPSGIAAAGAGRRLRARPPHRAVDCRPRLRRHQGASHPAPGAPASGSSPLRWRARCPKVFNADTYLAGQRHRDRAHPPRPGPPAGYEVRAASCSHRDAAVEPDVTVVVGDGRRGARLERGRTVGPTSIGCDATVEGGALVSRSAVWRRSRIGADAVLDRSIVGDDGIVGHDRRLYRAVVTGEVRRGSVTVPAPQAATSQSPRSAA
ncbi:MAG: NDP-sugar synthase [Vicinamibacterales bacterium]